MEQYDTAADYFNIFLSTRDDGHEHEFAQHLLNDSVKFMNLKNFKFWKNQISATESMLLLCLSQNSNSNVREATHLLRDLNDDLNIVATKCSFSPTQCEPQLIPEFLAHFRGQLSLHATSLLFKREIELNNDLTAVIRKALPLLLLSSHFGIIDSSKRWAPKAKEETRECLRSWHSKSSVRLVQASRVLESSLHIGDVGIWNNMKKIFPSVCLPLCSKEDVLIEAQRMIDDPDWRKQISFDLFGDHDSVLSKEFGSVKLKWPHITHLDCFQHVHPSNLEQIIYFLLTEPNKTDFDTGFVLDFLEDLGVSNALVNKIDMYVFLFATAIQTYSNMQKAVLPLANMTSAMCTNDQSRWWKTACMVATNSSERDEAIFNLGINAVRGMSGTKMESFIACKLGQICVKRSQMSSNKESVAAYENRAENLFIFGLKIFQTDVRNEDALFQLNGSDFQNEKKNLAEEAITFLCAKLFEKNAFMEIIDILQGIQLPFSYFFLSECYRKMNEIPGTPKKSQRSNENRALKYYNETLELLSKVDSHPLKYIIDARACTLLNTHSDNEQEREILASTSTRPQNETEGSNIDYFFIN